MLFPWELPLHPSCVRIPYPWGLDPFSIPVLGDRAGWLQLWVTVCTMGQPKTPELPQILLGWAELPVPSPPLASFLPQPSAETRLQQSEWQEAPTAAAADLGP